MKRKSSFDACVKIRKSQLLWLKENKTCKTDAGFLDMIINKYKEENCFKMAQDDLKYSKHTIYHKVIKNLVKRQIEAKNEVLKGRCTI